jgi:cytoskeletal protein RodZ
MTSASASRVTRSSRSLRLAVLLFLGVLSVATVLRAQEPGPASTGKPATSAGSPGTDAASAAREAAPDVETPAKPSADAPDGTAAAPAPKGPAPSRFEPTEKVRADFDVSFPIDI